MSVYVKNIDEEKYPEHALLESGRCWNVHSGGRANNTSELQTEPLFGQ